MNKVDFIQLSKTVSHALRHEPQSYNLNLDNEGWVLLSDLVIALNSKGIQVDEFGINKMVELSEKKRHQVLNGKIRAYYGHSVENKILKNPVEPPTFLYHGTTQNSLINILEKGLLPMKRQYVHLSIDRSRPWYTPYQFAGNDPIECVDLDGAEPYDYRHVMEGSWVADLTTISSEDIVGFMVAQSAISFMNITSRLTGVRDANGNLTYAKYELFHHYLADGVEGTYIGYQWVTESPGQVLKNDFVDMLGVVPSGGPTGLLAKVPGKAAIIKALANSGMTSGLKVALGKTHTGLKELSDQLGAFNYSNWKRAFGIPDGMSFENQFFRVTGEVIKAGGKILFDLKDVDIARAKKGFKNLEEAIKEGKITEWELSKILRDKELLDNTIFHKVDKLADKTQEGLNLIE